MHTNDAFAGLGSVPMLTADEERVLVERLLAGDRGAQDRLIVGNLRLACAVGRRMAAHMGGLDMDDCIGAACLGLVKAGRGFDARRGVKFSTYAWACVEDAVRCSVRGGMPLGGDVPDVQDGAPGPREDAERRDLVDVLLAGLDEEERGVVMMVFGIYDGDVDEGGLSRAEVGRRRGLSRGAVSLIVKRALAGMRRRIGSTASSG